VKVKVEPSTQSGKVLRLRSKGLPSVNSYGNGDLLVNISIYIPERLSDTEKNKIKELANSDNFHPSQSVKDKIFNKFRDLVEN
jgi:molecular chaperone DnaJ